MKTKENYKCFHPMTRQDLWDWGLRIYVDGVLQELNQEYKRDSSGLIREIDGKYITFYKKCPKYSFRSKWVHPYKNDKEHPKGEIGMTSYYSLLGLSLHRVLYIWFYNDLLPEMDICHIDHNWSNNNLSNLKQDTHRNNLSERRGSINQYGKRKKDRKE